MIGNGTLDFRIAVSSLSTILGGVGYGAYASANAFMDAFVAGADAAWQSINFDAWRFAGAEAHVTAAQLALTPSEGADAFARILAAPHLRQVIVSTADLDARLQQWVTRTEASGSAAQSAEAGPRYERPALAQAYHAPTNEIEEQVAAVWGELFGIDRVGSTTTSSNWAATRCSRRSWYPPAACVRHERGCRDDLRGATVAELSVHLMEKMLEQDEADGAKPLLSELQQLSEEDVVRELRQKSGV